MIYQNIKAFSSKFKIKTDIKDANSLHRKQLSVAYLDCILEYLGAFEKFLVLFKNNISGFQKV